MNNELIEKVDKALKYAKDYIQYVQIKGTECYKECGFEYDNIIPKKYDEEKKVKELEYIKEVLLKLNEENIELKEKYYITDNIYLSIFLWNNKITFMFYLENDYWLYENFIDSHSGITEWLNDFINELYALYSGNSDYCHAFGTCNLKCYKNKIENKDKQYSTEQVVKYIKRLITYFTDENNEIRNTIIEDIEERFKKLQYLIEKVGNDENN